MVNRLDISGCFSVPGAFASGQRLVLLITMVFAFGACTLPPPEPQPPAPDAGSNFSLYLQPLPQEAGRLGFTLGEVAALRESGGPVPLSLRHQRFPVPGREVTQIKLTRERLPEGTYRGIALTIASASIHGEQGAVNLHTPRERLVLEYPFVIQEERSEALFLSLSGERLVTDGVFFTPRFSLWQPQRLLPNLKGFVSNTGSGTLTVFNKRNAQVVDSIHIGGRPGDLALDQQRGWLYIALRDANRIAVVEVVSEEVLGQVHLRFGDEPVELELSRDGRTLLALNRSSASVSVIDTQTLFEKTRIRLSSEPSGLFFGRDNDTAFVTHDMSSRLSVLDLRSGSVRDSLLLEEAPLDGIAAADRNELYLINRFSGDLTVLENLAPGNKKTVFIGPGAATVEYDPVGRLVYVGLQDGDIAVVDPRSQLAIDYYRLSGGAVRRLVIDNDQNALFALMPEAGQLLKIDLVGKKVLDRLVLESGASSVVVMGER